MLDQQNPGNITAVLVSKLVCSPRWSTDSAKPRLTLAEWRLPLLLASPFQHGRNAAATAIRPELDSAIDRLLPAKKLTKAPAASTAARRRPVVAKRDWAHVVDVNREIANFRELVPDMAREVGEALALLLCVPVRCG